ncbi:MAG: FimB/Mfa2 family fimbrial subunit [Tannerellaceae bacterium]|nr:FimB/Mfa2 family fimbrial subunit [Tannerellaceae bacterium]
MKRLNNLYAFLLLLAPVVFQSCIQDDLSGCISDKRIFFTYEQAVSAQKHEGINPDDITRMNLFIFDENNLFVKEYIDESPRMSPEYYMTVRGLKAGQYKLVAWGNLKEQYGLSTSTLIPGETKFDDLRVALKSIENGLVEESLVPLFFATHTESNSIEVKELESQSFRLNLVDNLYKIHVTVAGLDSAAVANYDYSIDISDDNGMYRFNNDFASCDPFTYTQPSLKSEDSNELKATLNVLRLTAKRTPILRMVNKQTKKVMIESNLVKLILSVNDLGASIDFNKTHEFDIRYELDQRESLGIIIYINGWKLIEQGEIL